ncbi:hypothetical protein C8Q77DRAFT_1262323 [Trametes polyzona]|nr:hypothetical protein C8Q77DRAFT_1262323 [Trametes polyzona]
MLPLPAAGILSTTLQAILYGYAVFMFMLAMWIMLRDRRRRQVNYALVGAGCALIVLGTAEMAVNIARIYQGFVTIGPFVSVSDPTFVAKSIFYNTQTLILDAVVIYRTYIVWQNVLVVIFPLIGWCGLLGALTGLFCRFWLTIWSAGGSIGLNIALVNSSKLAGDVFAVQTGRWITAVYALTLGTNLSSTLLLAGRIWTVTRRSAQYRSSDILGPVLRVIIESGAIYSMTITAALISFVVKSNGVYVILDMISPIISIVFNMLIIRVGLASERNALAAAADGTTHGTWAAAGTGSGSGAGSVDRVVIAAAAAAGVRRRADGTLGMRDLKVEITQVIENDSEYTMVVPPSPVTFTPLSDGARRDGRLPGVVRDLELDSNLNTPRSSVTPSPIEKPPIHDPNDALRT